MLNPDQTQAILFDRAQQQGRLTFTDRDRLDLLQRMSTNDFSDLQQGEGRSTVLTTALARIIDRLIVYHRGETALVIANRPATVRAWLQRHIFFQDKVKLRDVSAEIGQLELYGTQATQILGRYIPDGAAALDSLALHSFREGQAGSESVIFARTFPMWNDGFTVIGATAALDAIKSELAALPSIVAGDDALYERLRIAAGIPGKDHELTEDYIPLEANLWDSVSFHKGCYIGQEIIARMESRNRLAKTLVNLRVEAGNSAEAIAVDVGGTHRLSLRDGERVVGHISSAAPGTQGESFDALGFVKPELAEAGNRLDVYNSQEFVGIAAITTVSLHR